MDDLIGSEPTPELLAELDEEYRGLLERLPDGTLRQIACWRMESYTAVEIAEKLGISPLSVERKLRLIRERWEPRLKETE